MRRGGIPYPEGHTDSSERAKDFVRVELMKQLTFCGAKCGVCGRRFRRIADLVEAGARWAGNRVDSVDGPAMVLPTFVCGSCPKRVPPALLIA